MFQISIDIAATGSRAEPRAGVKPIKPFYIAPVPLTFIDDELGKHTPPTIGNAFGQTVIADHPGDVQGFKANMAESSHNLARCLVQEIFALISHLFVLPGQGQPCFSPVFTALLAAAELPLQPFEFFLGFPQVVGVFNHRPAIRQGPAQGGKAPEADINPDRRLAAKLRGRSFHFTLDGDEILAGLGFRHGAVFHLPFHWPVKHRPNLAHLGQVDPTACHLEPLRIGDGLLVVLAVIVGISFGHSVLARFAVARRQRPLPFHPEKVPVSRIQLVQRTLKHLRIALVQPAMLLGLFQLFQDDLHIFFAEGQTVLKPGLLFEGQEMVIDKAGLSKLDGQLVLLDFVGVDAKAVADPGQVAATTADCPGQEPLAEAFRKGLFDPARADTLNAALSGQAHDFEFSEFLTYDNHLATLRVRRDTEQVF